MCWKYYETLWALEQRNFSHARRESVSLGPLGSMGINGECNQARISNAVFHTQIPQSELEETYQHLRGLKVESPKEGEKSEISSWYWRRYSKGGEKNNVKDDVKKFTESR